MKCSICSEKAVIYRRYEGRWLCKNHFSKDVEKSFFKTVRMNSLVVPGDKIAVGISGGKDSLSLLYLLNKLKKRKNFELEGILIDEGIKDYREHGLKKAKRICKDLGIKLHVVSFKKEFRKSLDEIVKDNNDPSLNACTFCGVFRRYLINKKAKEIGANKVAIGHNLDDEAQAIMANYIRGDLLRGSRIAPEAKITDEEGFIPRIKPLRDIPEKEIALFSIVKGLDVDFAECPYASESFRWAIRDIINDLEDRYPGTKFNIVRTFDKIRPLLVQEVINSNKKVKKCESCGEPSSRKKCKACELKEIIHRD